MPDLPHACKHNNEAMKKTPECTHIMTCPSKAGIGRRGHHGLGVEGCSPSRVWLLACKSHMSSGIRHLQEDMPDHLQSSTVFRL